MTGNCLRGSRPILSFDKAFQASPHLQLLQEMFTHVFGTPRGHPKTQPFNDHVMSFHVADGKIWYRHYQVVDVAAEGLDPKLVHKAGGNPVTLVEIGPRFVLDVVRIFKGSFGGPTLYANPRFVSPNKLRMQEQFMRSQRYKQRVKTESLRTGRLDTREAERPKDVLKQVFN